MGTSVPNRLLTVDLSTKEIAWEDLPAQWIDQYIGGKGIGARYLYEAVGPDTDPLAADNVLLLLVGPLTGYLPDGGRFAAVTKSPLTGLFLDSYAGGTFGPSFRAGFPAALGIAISGASDVPVLLDLREGEPAIRDATHLAGQTTDAVNAAYADTSVLCVGPAGEAGVAFATIAGDGGAHHAGRGGAGAVMGTKGLKAVVLDTDSPQPPTSEIRQLQAETRKSFAESPQGRAYRSAGTMESIEFADALAMLPTRGWQHRTFDGATELGVDAVESIAEDREDTDDTFPGDYRIRVGEYESVIRGGTPIALGAGLGFDDVDIVSALGATCDQLGIDVISAGNAVALAILASQAGRIDRQIDFGDDGEIERLIHEIGMRSTDLGDRLADGVDRAARSFDLKGMIPTVKAMAVPSFDPRGAPAMALAYATSDRGACHRRSVPATAEAFREDWSPGQIARAVVKEQDRRALHWCLIVDDVVDPMFGDLGQRWLAAFGYDLEDSDLGRIGSRTWTLTRLFNVREGVDRVADELPSLFSDGSDGIDQQTFEQTLDRYYEFRNWDRHGRPTPQLLDRLEIGDLGDYDNVPGNEAAVRRTDGGK